MARRPHSKRILRTTAAAVAVGAMAFAPLAPLAQEAANIALDPVAVRIGANDGFTRVEFAGVIGSRAQVRRDGQRVIVRVGSTAAPDVTRLKVDPPAGVEKVETRAVQGGTDVIVTLAPGAQARYGAADGAVWLNLYAPGQGPAAAAGSAVPASGVVPVTAAGSATRVSMTFQWAAPVGAAVFRRGEAVWVVFDTAARFDMSGATALGPAREARWASGPNYSAIRIAAPTGLAVSAVADGSAWTVTVGGAPSAATGVTLTRDDDSGPTALVVQMAGATRAIWLTDPVVGDRFAAVTALPPGKGFGARRRTVDLALIPSAQGLAIESAVDDLNVQADGDLVRLSRPSGLTLSAPSAQLATAVDDGAAPRRAPRPALILEEWGRLGHAGFIARRRELQDAATRETIAATDDPRAPIEARLALARFLVGTGLGYEAIGVLNALVAKTPSLGGEPEVRGLRGAARAEVGRFEEASADFASGSLAGDPSAKVWRGYIAAQQGDWAGARQAFAAGASVIDQFPQEWRARFGAAHALAAIETGDLNAARALLAYSFSQDAPAADQLTARLVQARLFELDGQTDRALAVYKAVAQAPQDGINTPAKLGATRLELAKGAITPDEATTRLEPLRWRWRGDATELAVIRTLGEIYLSQGRYREALDALRGAGTRLLNLPEAVQLQTDLSNAFRALFLEGAADGLQPVQALALFYDFRELTPVGADGDDMVRRLARRLVDVDLLDPAAELLKHQVDSRLEGVAKAQVATDLATVYLMDRQPEAALQALWSSRTTLLPTALNAERRALEARALTDLGRYDHALELLGSDQSPAAQDVRAEIFWKQQNYAAAAALYERRLGDRYKDAAPLNLDEESRLIRAGVGYSLSRDEAALGRLSRNWGGFVAGARSSSALRVALAGLDGLDATGPADFASLAARADTFTGWVNAMKAAMRAKTGPVAAAGGSGAPAPAPARPRPAAAGPAAA